MSIVVGDFTDEEGVRHLMTWDTNIGETICSCVGKVEHRVEGRFLENPCRTEDKVYLGRDGCSNHKPGHPTYLYPNGRVRVEPTVACPY